VRLLLAVLNTFREYIVLTLLSAVSIVLILNSDSAPVRVLRSFSVFTFASLQSTSSWIADLASPRVDEEKLREVNVELLEEVLRLRALRQENIELRRKIGFRERSSYPVIPAEIVGKSLTLGQNMVTLNVGENDSVRVNMPIINEEGLVGKIVATTGGYSIGMLALHRDFRVPSKVKRSRIDGIIAYTHGDDLQLRNVWKTADVLPGDTIVTTEYSSVFPSEVLIGTVQSIGPGEGGLFSQIVVRPFVSFSSLERVFVVRYPMNRERKRLEERHFPKEEAAQ